MFLEGGNTMNKRKIEKRERNKKDKEWAKQIKERDKCCVICGSKERLNAHHIIPREIKELRWELCNGITLCPRHHKFSIMNSPHKNPWVFLNILYLKRIKQMEDLSYKWNNLCA